MEITLQWLDDLDDLVFVFAFAWHRLCRLCLTLGFGASLLVITPGHPWAVLVALTGVALLSVLAWSVAVAATFICSTRAIAVSA
jgi:hypothetical protein